MYFVRTFRTIFLKSCVSNFQFFLFRIDQLIDSLGKVRSSENESGYPIHGVLWQHTASSILVCPIQTVLQTILSEAHVVLERLGQLLFRWNCEKLCVQKVSFENHAQHLSLDLIFSCSDFSLSVSRCQYASKKQDVSELLSI